MFLKVIEYVILSAKQSVLGSENHLKNSVKSYDLAEAFLVRIPVGGFNLSDQDLKAKPTFIKIQQV